jgi:hypothetical protein
MTDYGQRTPESEPIPDASGSRDGDPVAVHNRRGGRWLDLLTPSDARFLILPIFPRSDDDIGARVLKIVGIFAILAVSLGACFTMSRHLSEGRAILLMRTQQYQFEAKAAGKENDAAAAARAFRDAISSIRGH